VQNGKPEKQKALGLTRQACFSLLDRIRISKIIPFAASC